MAERTEARQSGYGTTDPRGTRVLRWAGAFFAVGSVLHNGDHFRRGLDSVTTGLQVAGWLAMAVSLVAIVLALAGHPRAPLVAVVAGFSLAVGFTASHWLPTWSDLSDSFVEGSPSGFSQAASILEIAGALALGAAGVYALRRPPAARRPGEPSSRAPAAVG